MLNFVTNLVELYLYCTSVNLDTGFKKLIFGRGKIKYVWLITFHFHLNSNFIVIGLSWGK